MSGFSGFSKELIKFYKSLAKNNSKQWFEKYRNDYDEFVLYNGLHAMREEKVPPAFYSEALVDYAFSHYKNMLPLHQWLKKVIDE
jgi:hypothetical protein